MQVDETISQAREVMTVKRVFGEPYEQNGVTIIPVARISGGAGGGTGENEDGSQGKGGGFGVHAAPAGVYIIKDDDVTWMPAIDINRVILGGQIVVVIFMLILRRILAQRRNQAD